jgi:LysM repeat protein
VSTNDLLQANGLTAKSTLRIGQKLKVPGAKPSAETKPAETSTTQETAPEISSEPTPPAKEPER